MNAQTDARPGPLGQLSSWLGGWHFPAIAITFVLAFAAFTLVVTFIPASPDGFGAFAEAFRLWCFGWDETPSYVPVIFMCSELIVFALIVWFIWSAPLRQAFTETRGRLLRTVGIATLVVIGAMGALISLGTPEARAFTLDAIRTTVPAPRLQLVDQEGEAFDLQDMRGQVVVVTAVYSTCGNTCPMLLGAARKAIAALTDAERADLRVIAVTLDPAHDTPENLTTVAFHQGADKPLWRLASGPVAEVEATLDRWSVARTRDPETGRIDHANVFMLIDRKGQLAFRLGLEDGKGERLTEALRLLLAEGAP